jgi:hypothetical protein
LNKVGLIYQFGGCPPCWSLRTILFVGFAAFTLFCALSNRDYTNQLFVVVLIGCIIAVGFIGVPSWPFRGWALMASVDDTDIQYYQIQVVNEEGSAYEYDPRAAPPQISASMRKRVATRMAESYDHTERRQLGCFLLKNAESYVNDRQSGGSVLSKLKYPRHQYGYRWNASVVDDLDTISAITINNKTFRMTGDGQRVTSRSERTIASISASQCS